MKKVRMTVDKDSSGKKIPVFSSPESLYVWLHDPELQDSQKIDPTFGSMIMLRPGEVMEVEWMGCEYVYEEQRTIRIDQIRLAKTIKIKSLKSSGVIGVHSGWTSEEIISFKSGTDGEIKRSKLTKKSKHKFNIQELFSVKGLESKEQPSVIDPQDLH